MSLKKTIEYEGKKIVVYEEAFNRRQNIDVYHNVVNSEFVRSNIDLYLMNNKDRDVKWKSVIKPDSELSHSVNPMYSSIINEIDWSKAQCHEQYINYGGPNTADVIHADTSSNETNAWTIIHYANHTWDVNWHGSTQFYTDNCTDIIYSAMIKPGSLVVFDPRIQHSSTAPSILAEYARYTIVTKIILKV
tara:strand:- start:3091 stop:3660 length:570 start_codon:yes stop_codon:yes gene_type:complete